MIKLFYQLKKGRADYMTERQQNSRKPTPEETTAPKIRKGSLGARLSVIGTVFAAGVGFLLPGNPIDQWLEQKINDSFSQKEQRGIK
jgi:hypothetical protein